MAHVQGRDEHVPMLALRIVVRSVLPADTALRVPKPARALLVTPLIPWWLVALLMALVVAAFWWLRRRRRRGEALEPAVDAFTRAEREFARVDALGLVEAGERGRYVTLVVEVLRDYLAARYPEARLSLTSEELLDALGGEAAVPRDALAGVVREADFVKFERRTLSTAEALAIAVAARGVVADEHAASAPPAPAEAEAA